MYNTHGFETDEDINPMVTPDKIGFLIYTEDSEEDNGIGLTMTCLPLCHDGSFDGLEEGTLCSDFEEIVNNSTVFDDIPFSVDNYSDSYEDIHEADPDQAIEYFKSKGYKVETGSFW